MPTVGEAIRVRVLGSVTATDATTFTVTTVDAHAVTFPSGADQGIKWDIVAAPEPEYIAGGFYRDSSGAVFIRNQSEFQGDAWIVVRHPGINIGTYVHYGFPVRPLVRLVPQT